MTNEPGISFGVDTGASPIPAGTLIAHTTALAAIRRVPHGEEAKQRQLKKKGAALKFSPAPARSREKAPRPIPQRNRHPAVERYLSLADIALGKKSHDRSKKSEN